MENPFGYLGSVLRLDVRAELIALDRWDVAGSRDIKGPGMWRLTVEVRRPNSTARKWCGHTLAVTRDSLGEWSRAGSI